MDFDAAPAVNQQAAPAGRLHSCAPASRPSLTCTCRGLHTSPAGITKLTWLVDFEGFSMWNAAPPSIAMETMHILQNHYPERLGAAICYHAPRLFSVTWVVGGLAWPLHGDGTV
jgi:hypothetical protein